MKEKFLLSNFHLKLSKNTCVCFWVYLFELKNEEFRCLQLYRANFWHLASDEGGILNDNMPHKIRPEVRENQDFLPRKILIWKKN